jgi:hypothetical protein
MAVKSGPFEHKINQVICTKFKFKVIDTLTEQLKALADWEEKLEIAWSSYQMKNIA